MKFQNILIPDNPLEEIKKLSDNKNLYLMPFDINDLLSSPPDTVKNIDRANYKRCTTWFSDPVRITAAMIYPPTGGMGWHTNSDLAGHCVYLSWSETGDSGMGWLNEDGTVRRDYDSPGWNIRVFDVPQWHCVFANCWRCSVGVKP